MRAWLVALLIGLLPLMALAESAAASVLSYIDLPTLVARSESVVRGRVVRQRSRWDAEHRQIFTDVEIAVAERYKSGGVPDRIVVRHLGGTVDGVGMRMLGEVSFARDEEVVLFLRRSGGGWYRSVALAQGKLRVVRAPGQPARAVRDFGGAVVVESSARGRARRSRAPVTVQSLDSLAVEIHALVVGGP